MIKRVTKFIFSVVISGLALELWNVLLILDNKDQYTFDVVFTLPFSLGLGWGVYQVLFVLWKKIKEDRGIGFGDLLKITLQSTLISFVVLMILLQFN